MMAHRKQGGHPARQARGRVRAEREVLVDIVRRTERWISELPRDSALIPMIEGFGTGARRLSRARPEAFDRFLREAREEFERVVIVEKEKLAEQAVEEGGR